MATMTAHTPTTSTDVEVVPRQGLLKAGFRAHCHQCQWGSYRYDKEVTAKLVASAHDLVCWAHLHND